jgi:phosphopantetheinyl transferase (holo-ACP synthase)
MSGSSLIGNDVVDLHFFDSPDYHHVNYLERTCTPEEARVIRHGPQPSKSLALVWASKEALYKLVSKQFAINGFVPRRFSVDVDQGTPLEACERLVVNYAGIPYNVAITATERWVHAVATFPEGQNVHWTLRAMERSFPHARPEEGESKTVRALAMELLLKCGHKNAALEFVGRVPTLRTDNGLAGIDISLSHHGAYASAAIAWPLGDSLIDAQVLRGFVEVSSVEGTCSTCTA